MANNAQSRVLQAKVASDWLASIVDAHLRGDMPWDDFNAKMRAAHDDIAARGLTEDVSDMWRLRAYGSK